MISVKSSTEYSEFSESEKTRLDFSMNKEEALGWLFSEILSKLAKHRGAHGLKRDLLKLE